MFFEIAALFPLFPGMNELDQIDRIHHVLGTPPQQLLDKFQKLKYIFSIAHAFSCVSGRNTFVKL